MCFCGNFTYGVYGKVNTCNMPCMGNKNQICGNIWANSIYITSLGKYLIIVFTKYVHCIYRVNIEFYEFKNAKSIKFLHSKKNK